MKFSTKHSSASKLGWLVSCLAVLFLFSGCKKFNHPPVVTMTTVATGLTNPMGIEVDNHGNLWVSEGGTIANDGTVWVIKPNGVKYKAIINLSAFPNKQSTEPQGTSHILLEKGFLYVLSGDFLYRIDVSHFKPGDKPINAAKLAKEDVGAYMYSQKYPDSHAYNLTKGPDGDLYIADAGANAIIHRHGWNKYSILADLPGFKNPTPVGPPEIQAVPTSVWWDGHDFLVTTLTGFPFVKGLAVIYKVSLSGNVSIYQKGFSTLVNLAPGQFGNHIAVHYGDFGPMGFVPNSGSLVWANGSTMVPFVQNLGLPVGINQYDYHTWFVTITGNPDPMVKGSGSVIKVTYQ